MADDKLSWRGRVVPDAEVDSIDTINALDDIFLVAEVHVILSGWELNKRPIAHVTLLVKVGLGIPGRRRGCCIEPPDTGIVIIVALRVRPPHIEIRVMNTRVAP